MKDEIVVYWANNYFPYEALDPDYAIKDLYSRVEKLGESNEARETASLIKCPVASLYLRNTFRIKSPVDYSIYWDKENSNIYSKHYSQDFFNNYVIVRDPKSGVISLNFGSNVFFTEEENLTIEYKPACYAENVLANNISLIHGEIDIGRYFRFSDFACFINRPNELLEIKRGDVLYYVRFLTNKKVVLKRFNFTPELRSMTDLVMSAKFRTECRTKNLRVWDRLEEYYSLFKTSKIKNLFIKKIKENILE